MDHIQRITMRRKHQVTEEELTARREAEEESLARVKEEIASGAWKGELEKSRATAADLIARAKPKLAAEQERVQEVKEALGLEPVTAKKPRHWTEWKGQQPIVRFVHPDEFELEPDDWVFSLSDRDKLVLLAQ